jgi:hypothetical protein
MGKAKGKKKADGSGNGASGGGSCQPEELQQLLQLLPLLRSGSPLLKQLLSVGQEFTNGVAFSSRPPAAKPPVEKPKEEKTVPPPSKGWFTVEKKKKVQQQEEKRQDGSKQGACIKEMLVPDYWPAVTAVGSTAELTVDKPAVCLASASQARRVMAELKPTVPVGLLVPEAMENSTEMWVLTKDQAGKTQSRRRHLVQVGTGIVSAAASDAIKGQAVQVDACKVVLIWDKRHCKDWQSVLKSPLEAAKAWLAEQV